MSTVDRMIKDKFLETLERFGIYTVFHGTLHSLEPGILTTDDLDQLHRIIINDFGKE
jgi:hypothetical protein